MLHINLPIYYTQTFKTKKDKTFLVGMNWYRNAHYFIQNEVKKHYTEIVSNALKNKQEQFPLQYKLKIKIYYKNPSSDGSNIASLMEKFALDSFQEIGRVQDDNVKFHIGTSWELGGQDKENPRAEITLFSVIPAVLETELD